MTKTINLEETKQKDSEMIKGQHLKPQSKTNPYVAQPKKIQLSSMYGKFGNIK